jgi:O-acetyl-ADP-ribose deacetylase (regulator of RNase III)
VYQDGRHREPELLASCYRRSLALAAEHGATSIAFPAISCGAYGYPLAEAVEIAVRECADGVKRHPSLEKVIFACFDDRMLALYEKALADA